MTVSSSSPGGVAESAVDVLEVVDLDEITETYSGVRSEARS